MEITKRRLADIVPYAANAKKHDKRQINNVAESIKQYGFVQPIVIDRDGVIVIGHCRALAAKKLGMEEVPCVCVDDLTPEQVNAMRLVDNKSNESDWDFDLLADELPGLDLLAFDFDWGLPEDQQDSTNEYAHPTQKPVKLSEFAIRNTTERGGTVLDLFGGSGSTLIACEQLDRRCCMMELDPRYCDVIIKRWEQFTGEKAVLLHDD